jgi:hypothetical protein
MSEEQEFMTVRPYRITVEAVAREEVLVLGEDEDDAEQEAYASFSIRHVNQAGDDYSESIHRTEKSPTEIELVKQGHGVDFDFDDDCLYVSGKGELVLRNVYGDIDIGGKVKVIAETIEGGCSVGQDASLQAGKILEGMDVSGNAVAFAREVYRDVEVKDRGILKAGQITGGKVRVEKDGEVMADSISSEIVSASCYTGYNVYSLENGIERMAGEANLESDAATEEMENLRYFLGVKQSVPVVEDETAWAGMSTSERSEFLTEFVKRVRGAKVEPEEEGVKI